ncbi:MAG: ImmA/IrrE family metallo-endopeptidase [Verrucomicrobiaceae bacterium]|nr:MAG: ImmA/IrrE family metallo-endopeptidase [Verrucomicrobiaceae bacterium]
MATIDQSKVGDRLRLLRTAAGITQERAAEHIGVSRPTLIAVERGERAAKPEELLKFASLYGVSLNNIVRPTAIRVDIVGQFRKQPGADGTRAVAMLHNIAASYAELAQRLGKTERVSYPPEQKVTRGHLDVQAQEVATDVRSRLGLGTSPVPDLVNLLELEFGLRIFVRRLDSSIGGLFAFHEEIGACVLLNAVHSPARRRWTLSHELAHFMTSRNNPDISYMDTGEKGPDDIFADRFAAHFLMPSVVVRRIHSERMTQEGKFTIRDLVLGAHRLGVSLEAFALRLEELDLLPKGFLEALKKRGLNQDIVQQVLGEDFKEQTSVTSRIIQLAAEAHERGLYSEGQLADMLALDRLDLRKAVDDYAELEDPTFLPKE